MAAFCRLICKGLMRGWSKPGVLLSVEMLEYVRAVAFKP